MEDPVDDGVEQLDVVADDDQAALVALEVVAQPADRVGVEVVRGLVEQQRGRAREQDPRQLDPPALATGEGRQRLPEHPLLERQGTGDGRGLGLRGIPALGGELGLEPRVAAHRLVAGLVVGAGHRALGLAHLPDDAVEPARRQDAVAGQDVQVTRARVLREVADLAGGGDRPCGGLALTGEHLGERGLAGAVAAHQPDPVAGGDPERRAVEQEPGPSAQLDPTGGNHDGTPDITGGGGGAPMSCGCAAQRLRSLV